LRPGNGNDADLIADGYSEIDHGGLALFYEKLNSIVEKMKKVIVEFNK